MNSFNLVELPLPDLIRVERKHLVDERGFFSRLFCSKELAAVGWNSAIEQINHSYTREKGVIRGMHFQQHPKAETKLVSCIRGEVYDVVVDVRRGSPTFLHWHAEHLSADNRTALLIPRGFAHGFQSLTTEAELLYCHDQSYYPSYESGLNPLDPQLNISWPIEKKVMSEKDGNRSFIDDLYKGEIV